MAGYPPARYAGVSDSGRVLEGEDGPEYAPDTIWDNVAEAPLELAELEDLIARGVSDARSGVAQPARASVCRPSVPGDEDSAPICR